MASKAAKGKRAKTRHKVSSKGPKVTVNKLLQEIPVGTSVNVITRASIHGGMPFRRHHGLTGRITGRQGKAYLVSVRDGGKQLELILGAAHIEAVKGTQASGDGSDGKVAS